MAIDPSPQPGLVAAGPRARARSSWSARRASTRCPRSTLADVVVIDGDHNYYTVSEELRLIGERAPGADLPLLLFHDVCWPHARRDDYFAPERDPGGATAIRSPARPAASSPASRGCARRAALPAVGRARGRPAQRRADRGRGLRREPRRPAARRSCRPSSASAWSGIAGAPWARRVAEIVGPWDRHPLLRAARGEPRAPPGAVRTLARWRSWSAQERLARQEAVLRRLLESSAFAVAERLSRLRVRRGHRAGAVGDLEGRDPPGAGRLSRAGRSRVARRATGSAGAAAR